MDALRGPRRGLIDLEERPAEQLGGDDALGDPRPSQVEEGLRRHVAGHPHGVLEVVVVVAAVAADGESVGERLPRTARPADSLLVVEPLRRHVAHQDGLQ